MEVFSRILDKCIRDSEVFKFHWRCRKTRLSHLCFADDLMIFCRGDVASVKVVKDALHIFSSLSGLQPNAAKSTIFLSGVESSVQTTIVDYLGFQLGTLPVRYLGVPLISTKLKASDCHALEDRILKQVKTWTNRFLSFAGRLQLIQSVLFSIQAYWSSHFVLPSRVAKSIESTLSAFLWNGVALKKHGIKVSWEEVSKPKVEGGLGLKKIKDWNLASMVRYVWLLCQPTSSSLWVSWVKVNLLHKEQFWVAKVPWNCSWTWRKILKLRTKVKAYITIRVGNGEHTSLWFDSWMPRGAIFDSSNARVIYDSGLPREAKVSSIIDSGQWRWPVANSPDLLTLKEESLNLPLPNSSCEDKLLWNGSRDFSIKSAWELLRSPSPRIPWKHIVWFKFHIPRHSFILWLAIRNRLSTQDRLLSFGMILVMKCHLCGDNVESHDHLFFACSYSLRVWKTILSKCDMRVPHLSWVAIQQWVSSAFKGSTLISYIGRLAFAATVYFLWHERNARFHGGVSRNEATLITLITDVVRLRLIKCSGFPNTSSNLHFVHTWQLSPSLIGLDS